MWVGANSSWWYFVLRSARGTSRSRCLEQLDVGIKFAFHIWPQSRASAQPARCAFPLHGKIKFEWKLKGDDISRQGNFIFKSGYLRVPHNPLAIRIYWAIPLASSRIYFYTTLSSTSCQISYNGPIADNKPHLNMVKLPLLNRVNRVRSESSIGPSYSLEAG